MRVGLYVGTVRGSYQTTYGAIGESQMCLTIKMTERSRSVDALYGIEVREP